MWCWNENVACGPFVVGTLKFRLPSGKGQLECPPKRFFFFLYGHSSQKLWWKHVYFTLVRMRLSSYLPVMPAILNLINKSGVWIWKVQLETMFVRASTSYGYLEYRLIRLERCLFGHVANPAPSCDLQSKWNAPLWLHKPCIFTKLNQLQINDCPPS